MGERGDGAAMMVSMPATSDHPDAHEGLEPDPSVLSDLVQDHGEAVYRVALSVVFDPMLAEDITQETLIRAWQGLDSFRGESSLRGWIVRIARNTAISALRKRRDIVHDPAELPEPEPGGSVEHRVEDRAALAAFEQALASLDEVSRSIVVLRELEQLSYAEIADSLDLTIATVKTRLLRARRLLATKLEGWQP